MKNILFISATGRNNLNLAKEMSEVIEGRANFEVLDLEALHLPLFTPLEEKNGVPEAAKKLVQMFLEADGVIIATPEYNGGTPPVLVNAIAWLSRSGNDDWRAAFNEKYFVLASHSAGGGQKVLTELRLRLDHLGAITLPRVIIVNKSRPLNIGSVEAVMDTFFRAMGT